MSTSKSASKKKATDKSSAPPTTAPVPEERPPTPEPDVVNGALKLDEWEDVAEAEFCSMMAVEIVRRGFDLACDKQHEAYMQSQEVPFLVETTRHTMNQLLKCLSISLDPGDRNVSEMTYDAGDTPPVPGPGSFFRGTSAAAAIRSHLPATAATMTDGAPTTATVPSGNTFDDSNDGEQPHVARSLEGNAMSDLSLDAQSECQLKRLREGSTALYKTPDDHVEWALQKLRRLALPPELEYSIGKQAKLETVDAQRFPWSEQSLAALSGAIGERHRKVVKITSASIDKATPSNPSDDRSRREMHEKLRTVQAQIMRMSGPLQPPVQEDSSARPGQSSPDHDDDDIQLSARAQHLQHELALRQAWRQQYFESTGYPMVAEAVGPLISQPVMERQVDFTAAYREAQRQSQQQRKMESNKKGKETFAAFRNRYHQEKSKRIEKGFSPTTTARGLKRDAGPQLRASGLTAEQEKALGLDKHGRPKMREIAVTGRVQRPVRRHDGSTGRSYNIPMTAEEKIVD